MKTITVILSLGLFIGCNSKVETDNYGEPLSDAHTLETTEMVSLMSQTDSAEMKVTGTINKTCSMKGCWMMVQLPDGDEMRVTFKDYGFFVPKEGMEGKEVTFEGVAMKSTTDVETLQHYAQDAGKSEEEIAKITSPKEELIFVATGVEIPKSQE